MATRRKKPKDAVAEDSGGAAAPAPGGDLQGELLSLALLALALFLFLSLLPTRSNLIGPVGALIAGGLFRSVGGCAGVVPMLLLVAGLRTGGWLSPGGAWRLGALGVGFILLVAPGLDVLMPGSESAGWLGVTLGEPLVRALNRLGAGLLLAAALMALSVVTLGWRPVQAMGQGVALSGSAARWGAGFVGARWLAWRAARAAAAQARAEAEQAALAEIEPPPLEPFERETGEVAAPVPIDPVPVAPVARPRKVREPKAAPDPATLAEEPADRTEKRPHDTALPPLDLLTEGVALDSSHMDGELDRLGQVLVEKLRTFNVESHIGGRTTGPVVTQFEVVPAPGVKVNRIANLDADLALAMKAQSIRIVAPIPGKGAVGVEIPNPESAVVQLREIVEAKEFRQARGDLPLALGRDLTGKPYVADLAKMPHVLIAGATGSGKSVCINTVVTSLVYRHTPETLRLLMIDPKMVELSAYADLPHLRHAVVTDPRDAAGVLKWAVLEMERRYALLSANGQRSIADFNQRVKSGKEMKRAFMSGAEDVADRWRYEDGILPYIVVVVDELADLMMTVQSEIEKPLAQLAQKARAIGIHLIVATQRPSVNVITGLIKANFPTRVAFRVASKTDSRTILDQNGSEALLGNGDMLFLPPGKSEPVRIQGAFISTDDTERLLDWYRARRDAAAAGEAAPSARTEADILEEVRASEQEEMGGVEEISGDWDELFRQAAEVCIQHDQGSTSLLQRRLKIGYGRAARIVDQLHEAGVLGPPDGSKPREVLIGMSELDTMFPGA